MKSESAHYISKYLTLIGYAFMLWHLGFLSLLRADALSTLLTKSKILKLKDI